MPSGMGGTSDDRSEMQRGMDGMTQEAMPWGQMGMPGMMGGMPWGKPGMMGGMPWGKPGMMGGMPWGKPGMPYGMGGEAYDQGDTPYGKGGMPFGMGMMPWGKPGMPFGKGGMPFGKPFGKGDTTYDKGGFGKPPVWGMTPGGGFAKQYPPGMMGIPYGYYPGYGLVQ